MPDIHGHWVNQDGSSRVVDPGDRKCPSGQQQGRWRGSSGFMQLLERSAQDLLVRLCSPAHDDAGQGWIRTFSQPLGSQCFERAARHVDDLRCAPVPLRRWVIRVRGVMRS